MNTVGRQERYKKAFIVVLVAVLLSSCIFIGTVLAWLQQDTTRETEGILNLGEVDFEIYTGGTKITSTKDNANGVTTSSSQELVIPAGSTIRSIDLKIRNTGNIDAIMRVTLNIYYKEYYDTDKYNKVAYKRSHRCAHSAVFAYEENIQCNIDYRAEKRGIKRHRRFSDRKVCRPQERVKRGKYSCHCKDRYKHPRASECLSKEYS